MKLFYSPTSPFARKVRIVAHEFGLQDQIEFMKVDPLSDDDELINANPLSQIPTLVIDDGVSLFDSSVIANYLDELAVKNGRESLFQPRAINYYDVQRMHALASGIMENSVALTMERRRPVEQQSQMWKLRWEESILRSISFIAKSDERFEQLHIGNLSFVIALEYIDFRQPQIDWRDDNEKLVSAIVEIQQRASFIETRFA